MKVHLYTIRGKVRIGKQYIPFRKTIAGVKINDVIEKVFCELGSRHKVKRSHIIIESVSEEEA